MISVKEAQKLIIENASFHADKESALEETSGRILAETVFAPAGHPLFDQSAVDGYAFRFADIAGKCNVLAVKGEIKAGDFPEIIIHRGEAVRIFTGAAIPDGSDTVVMQEFTSNTEGTVVITDTGLKKGGNIRKKSEQIKKGETVLHKGTSISPAAIGFLASLGITKVKSSGLPSVGIIITGNEFIKPEEDLRKGKIFESNGSMLKQALKKTGINADCKLCPDDPSVAESIFRNASDINELLLITGGVSVGDYDYTKATLEKIGFKTVFHKVAQKPGKPLLFAKNNNKAAFGLPGNPLAVMICFYEYVYPFIMASQGARKPFLHIINQPLAENYRRKPDGKTHFLAAISDQNNVELLGIQGSHMLQSLSMANAIVKLNENQTELTAGNSVEVHLIN